MSDDGAAAIVVIALLGNPFSPGYARARRSGAANPIAFSSMNVAVYAGAHSAWSFTERRVREDDRTATGVHLGRSVMHWEGDRLVVEVHERTAPLGRPLRGRIVLHPEIHTSQELSIGPHAEHRWWPVAPRARIEVDLPQPGVRFSGHGYHDANAGDVPLESSFERWSWSRARTPRGAILTYDVTCRSGAERSLAMQIAPDGSGEAVENSRLWPMGATGWGLERQVRADEGQRPRLVRSLEDGPFYARALVETRLAGLPALAMHETLAAERLRRGWVRFLTAFRMRRET